MVNKLLCFIYQLLPINKKKILFISHLGKSYGCNPKYICEFLLSQHVGEFVLHWVYDSTCCGIKDIPLGVIPIDLNSRRFQYDIQTCGILISNTRLPKWFNFKKRKGQRYIQTWHSSLRLKKIEGDAHLGKVYEEMARADSAQISIIVSGCRFSSEIYQRAFWYEGPLLEVGTPRIDYLLQQQRTNRQNLLAKAGLNVDTHYALYAPTFRKSGTTEAYNIDYKMIVNALERRHGGSWKILCRLHPNLRGKTSFLHLDNICIDMTNYSDMQELLVIADILITDFSSSMFDMAFMRKPCFLYASDLETYLQTERGLYFNISDLPFPIASTNETLKRQIYQFDVQKYQESISQFLSSIGSYENGIANEKIYDYIIKG
jgi:CDP-glycerol glycerophosphotransferase